MHLRVVAAVLALTACTAPAPSEPPYVPALGPGAPTPRADATSTPFVLQPVDDLQRPPGGWDSARTDGERALLLSFLGAPPGRDDCESDYIGVTEVEPERVVVRIDPVPDPATRSDQVCPAVGYTRTVRVELPEPLGGRAVVDAQTGEPGPLLDGAALLAPPTPPDGYTFRSESGSYGAGASWSFEYSAGDRGPVLTVRHAQDLGEPLEEPLLTVLERTDVGGHEAVVLAQFGVRPLRVAWRERGGVVSVQNAATHGTGDDERLLTKAQLVAFARSLR